MADPRPDIESYLMLLTTVAPEARVKIDATPVADHPVKLFETFERTAKHVFTVEDENRRVRRAHAELDWVVGQILGAALGYPWFKDDQANFPGATTADGVNVGNKTARDLAAEAAERLGTA